MDVPRRILLIRPSALGDVCRSVPVLASLKRAYPGAEVDWLVQSEFVEAIEGHPALRSVVPFPRKELRGAWWARRDGRRMYKELAVSLRDPGYDLVVDCQGLGRSGFFTWLTRAPARWGYANARELGWLGYSRRFPIGREGHSVDRMLGLIEAAGVEPVRDMRLHTTEAQRASVDDRLASARFMVVAPTTRWPGKRWPDERFARVIEAVLGQGWIEKVAVVGGAGERGQCATILEAAERDERVVDLVGGTTVGGLMALIERSALVLANDSAAAHMAVGFDRPLVALFGPTRIDLVGPYGREADVIGGRAPKGVSYKDEEAGLALLKRITLDEVVDAVAARITRDRAPANGGCAEPASRANEGVG